MQKRSRADYQRQLSAKHPGRHALAVRRSRARRLGLSIPELPPIERPVYTGVCACGVTVTRFKADARTDRCNGCRRKELRECEYAKRRGARKAAGPAIYKGSCTACGIEVVRRKSDGRTDRCDVCRSAEYWRIHGEKWKPNARKRARERHQRTYATKKAAGTLWVQKNREKRRAHANNWHKRHRDQSSAAFCKYMAAKNQRLPQWTDLGAIAAFYAIARRATACTGIRFDVDHIVPLRGRTVSGLHVPENLRVLPKTLNSKKSNRLELT